MVTATPIGADQHIRINNVAFAFATSVGRNIAPGSTAGLAGLVLPTGLADGMTMVIELGGPAGSARKLFVSAWPLKRCWADEERQHDKRGQSRQDLGAVPMHTEGGHFRPALTPQSVGLELSAGLSSVPTLKLSLLIWEFHRLTMRRVAIGLRPCLLARCQVGHGDQTTLGGQLLQR
jgi:hypothetical protein